MTIDRTDHRAAAHPDSEPNGRQRSERSALPVACPYLGRRGDEFTHYLQPNAGHRCHALDPATRIESDHQLTHCLHDHSDCPRFIPLVDGRRAQPGVALSRAPEHERAGEDRGSDPAVAAVVGRATGADTVAGDGNGVDGLEHLPGIDDIDDAEDAALRFDRRPGWLRRRSFEEWLIAGVTTGLLGVIAYFVFLGDPRGGEAGSSGGSSAAIQSMIAALDATETPTPTREATRTPRPTDEPDLVVVTVTIPTPPPGGLSAALSPVERGVASFNEMNQLPDFGRRELSVGTIEGNRFLGGVLFSLSKLPSASRIEYVALELAGRSDTGLVGDGEWTVEMLDPEVADGWADLTFSTLDDAPATQVGRAWTMPGDQLAPRRVNVLEFSDEAREALISRLDQGRVAFRIRGPEAVEGADDLFIWDTGFGEGFGTRPVLRVNFVPPTPTPGAAPGEPTQVPLIVWIGRPTPAPTATPLPGSPPGALDGMILFISDRFGGDGRLMVYDPVGDRIGQVTQPWVYRVARDREQHRDGRRLIVYDVPCGFGGATIEGEDGGPIPNPDPARRCQQIALHAGSDGPPLEITEAGWTHYDPAFSPDGRWIVYTSQLTGNDEIFKIRVDGTENTRLTDNEWPWDKHPSFSPDGSSIVFWSNRDGHRQLFLMDADGGNVRPLLTGPWDDWDPVWVK